MSPKATTSGWVVQITLPGVLKVPTGSAQQRTEVPSPTFRFYNVAVADADQAVEAVRKKAGVTSRTPIRTVRALSPPEISALSLRVRQVRLA